MEGLSTNRYLNVIGFALAIFLGMAAISMFLLHFISRSGVKKITFILSVPHVRE